MHSSFPPPTTLTQPRTTGMGKLALLLIASFFVACSVARGADHPGPATQPSPLISGVTWDFEHLVRKAHGSDLWPVTWGADGDVYTGWGDGG